MKTPHMKGFTLIEVVVVVAIMAILTVVAVPSMMTMIRKNQLQQETRDFVATLNEARAEAILKRSTVYLGHSSSSSSGDIQHDAWEPKRKNKQGEPIIRWEEQPQDPIVFDYLGRINVKNNVSECVILTHSADASLKAVVLMYRQGTIRYIKDAQDCSVAAH